MQPNQTNPNQTNQHTDRQTDGQMSKRSKPPTGEQANKQEERTNK